VNRPLRIGCIDLSFHVASAAVVQAVLAGHGHASELDLAPHEEAFLRFGHGQTDFLVSAWLPASHGGYLAPWRHLSEQLGVLYRPFCLWGVPDYVPEDAVRGVADLLGPAALERMERRIQGINPGAGISRFSQAIVREYGLDRAGYHWRPGSEDDCFGGFERAVAGRRWLVVPLWQPQYLHHRYRIRALDEPRGLLGGVDEATLLVRRDVAAALPAATLDHLRRLAIGNAAVAELDHRLRVAGEPPLAAARAWLSRQDTP
jgi:glycine betaine/proline transport system substrate-binding protein